VEKGESITLPRNIKREVLESVVVLLVTVNDKENLAAHCYLKPLDGHEKVYLVTQCIKRRNLPNEYAIYHIGKYGACLTAVRIIPPGSDMYDGSNTIPMMAYNCFPNLGAVIGVGVAHGVKNRVKICDVLVSERVMNYHKAGLQEGTTLSESEISASAYLKELFCQAMNWPTDEIKKRLEENNVARPAIKLGKILCGPQLNSDTEIKKKLIKTFAPEIIGMEMEGAYLFAGTQQTNAHTIIVKEVCDFGDENTPEQFQSTAALLAADCVNKFLSNPQLPEILDGRKGLHMHNSAHIICMHVVLYAHVYLATDVYCDIKENHKIKCLLTELEIKIRNWSAISCVNIVIFMPNKSML